MSAADVFANALISQRILHHVKDYKQLLRLELVNYRFREMVSNNVWRDTNRANITIEVEELPPYLLCTLIGSKDYGICMGTGRPSGDVHWWRLLRLLMLRFDRLTTLSLRYKDSPEFGVNHATPLIWRLFNSLLLAKSIKRLHISGRFLHHANLYSFLIEHNAPSLEEISVGAIDSMRTSFTLSPMLRALADCRALKRLHFRSGFVRDDDLAALRDNPLVSISFSRTMLQNHLSLARALHRSQICELILDRTQLMGSGCAIDIFLSASPLLPNLRHLTLGSTETMHLTQLQRLCVMCPVLQSLRLSRMTHVEDLVYFAVGWLSQWTAADAQLLISFVSRPLNFIDGGFVTLLQEATTKRLPRLVVSRVNCSKTMLKNRCLTLVLTQE